MKCFYCDQEAKAICDECGRASCKEHGMTTVHHAHVTAGFRFVCKDCLRASQKPSIEVPSA